MFALRAAKRHAASKLYSQWQTIEDAGLLLLLLLLCYERRTWCSVCDWLHSVLVGTMKLQKFTYIVVTLYQIT
jgi:hypothetical protein